jgi:hypothetical protein
MKTYSNQNGFFSIGLGLALLVIGGGTAAVTFENMQNDNSVESVQEQRPAYEPEYAENYGPE